MKKIFFDKIHYKNKLKEIYNENYHYFVIYDEKINYIIKIWKKYTIKFSKYSIFENIKDYNGNIILTDYYYYYWAYKENQKNMN